MIFYYRILKENSNKEKRISVRVKNVRMGNERKEFEKRILE